MAFTEKAYIALLRKQAEEKFGFGNGNGYTQRDLQLLAGRIEEKTGVVLSLSTLKRLWKNDFKQRPQPATLDALAAVLDYRDWQDFKLHNRPETEPGGRKLRMLGVRIAITVLIALLAVFLITPAGKRTEGVEIKGPVQFTSQKTVATGTPATVIFTYDLAQVKADSFFIQQSWNPLNRVHIDPAGKAHSSVYYEAGYHRARLVANDSVIAIQPVHILSDGWEPYLYYSDGHSQPVSFADERIIQDGRLHLSRALLRKKNIDFDRAFMTRISYSSAFNVPSDHFSLISRIKLDSVASQVCPAMQVTVVTEKHIFWVNLQQPGCEGHASYKMGELIRYGQQNDLSQLGVDGYVWQEVGITVENKQAEITLNGRSLYRETFQDDFGDIKGLLYLFSGTGSLDYVRLAGASDRTVLEDDFETGEPVVAAP